MVVLRYPKKREMSALVVAKSHYFVGEVAGLLRMSKELKFGRASRIKNSTIASKTKCDHNNGRGPLSNGRE